MNAETKNRLREILAEAQMRVNQIAPGHNILLVEAERTKTEIEADVVRALQDRQSIGLSSANNFESSASATLDGIDQQTRDLIERALQESSGLEVEK